MEINGEYIVAIEQGEEIEFDYNGCENCANGLGTAITKCKAYAEDKTVKPGDPAYMADYYTVNLCHACLCAHHNGDELPDDCRNDFKV